jgi:hypothetical protein
MRAIAEEACGLVIYEHQEGRGIGLMAKLQAYSLQDAGLDTVEANEALGLMADCRTFGLPAAILIPRARSAGTVARRESGSSGDCEEVSCRIKCDLTPSFYWLSFLGSVRPLHRQPPMTRRPAVRQQRARTRLPTPIIPGGFLWEAWTRPFRRGFNLAENTGLEWKTNITSARERTTMYLRGGSA